MPLIDEAGMSAVLKSEPTKNVFIIFGDDDYLKAFYCEKLVNAVVSPSLKTFNYHVYCDEDTKLEDIFADAENLPVMSAHTCLLIKNYPLHKASSEQLKAFEKSLASIPETTVMVFYYNTVEVEYNKLSSAKWYDIINLFARVGYAVELDHRTVQKEAAMLVSGAAKRDSAISKETALYLIECVGEDMQNLLNEFNKVCAYANGKEVTPQMIDEVCQKSIQAQVFDISTALLNGDTDKAFAVAGELINRKVAVQAIIGAMANTYTAMYRIKVSKASGMSNAELAKLFQYKNEYTLKSARALSGKITLAGIRTSIDVLLKADVLTKSQGYDALSLISELLARLATAVK